MAADQAEETVSTTASSPSGGGSKLVTILTLVNLVFTLGIAGVLVFSFLQEKKSTSVADISTQNADAQAGVEPSPTPQNYGKMISLDQFTVNLSTPGSINPKFARVNISLEVPTEDAEKELTHKMPQVRNVIIDLFNSKRPSDLSTSNGRDYLKEEIRNALNTFMVTGKVKGVFFTNFSVAG